jgi:hypothetical protein
LSDPTINLTDLLAGFVTIALIYPIEGFDALPKESCDDLKAQFQIGELKVYQIPRHAPLTPEQYETQAKLWPVISRFVSQYVLAHAMRITLTNS